MLGGTGMARLNIEDSFFIMLPDIAIDLGWGHSETFTSVAFLWHGSQSKKRVSGSRKDIRRWSKVTDDQLENFVSVLTEHELLEKISDDEFLIVGNKKHVKNLKKLQKSKRTGGKIRAKGAERDEKGHFQKGPASDQQPSSSHPAGAPAGIQQDPAQYNAMQCNAVQGNAKQNNSKQDKTVTPSPLSLSWFQFAHAKAPQYKFKAVDFEEGVQLVCRRAPISMEELERVFEWIKADSFWADNALSPSGLLKKSERNGMRKIDNILVKFRAATKSSISAFDNPDFMARLQAIADEDKI